MQVYILFRNLPEDCSLGDNLSDSSEELLQGVGEKLGAFAENA